MNAPSIPTGTREALGRARDQAEATLSALGGTVEELAHEVVGKVEENLPVLAERAGRLAGQAEAVAGAAAATALERLDEGVLTARRELAARIDPDTPSSRRWWWIGAGLLVTALSIVGWFVLSRRPQPVEQATEPPTTNPPGDVDVETGSPAGVTRTGHS
ncbi:hypothetical protein LWC33_29425 [Pseudonocardia sp. RS11V-5]|uniref:hypothetical protein n=1 Tax=Pseudonocardia terrae TaxID=2905831 RepID=UPI001E47619D|nr:hypothetical protein [Pseudonocardia terrae]MCE3555553.1 hypothetical protein [Pseudonocardia terrae]